MTDLTEIKVYATHPHSCSYLPKAATTLFIDPEARVDKQLYSQLSDVGFRRSGAHLYKPQCASCSACIPARVVAGSFTPTRSQRRIWRRNQHLRAAIVPSIASDEHYQLYKRYITLRHADGDMYPPSEEQYRSFLNPQWGVTEYLEVREGDTLLAVAVIDRLNQGLSAIYTFYEPDLPQYSLGIYCVLWQLDYARRLQLPFVYLGYWIKQCRKMAYKQDFKPLEILQHGSWQRLLQSTPPAG